MGNDRVACFSRLKNVNFTHFEVFFSGLGTFTGGYITKRLKLTRSQVIKMYIYCQAITVPCALAMMFYCNSENFAGVNVPYPVSSIPVRLQPDRILVPEDLQMKCNEKCSCDLKDFSPICDKSENIMYYSACTAGCLNQETIGKFKFQMTVH